MTLVEEEEESLKDGAAPELSGAGVGRGESSGIYSSLSSDDSLISLLSIDLAFFLAEPDLAVTGTEASPAAVRRSTEEDGTLDEVSRAKRTCVPSSRPVIEAGD